MCDALRAPRRVTFGQLLICAARAESPTVQGYCGTPHYCAPEVLASKYSGCEVALTSQILTWAVGMTIRCLLSAGSPKPWGDAHEADLVSGAIREVRTPAVVQRPLMWSCAAALPCGAAVPIRCAGRTATGSSAEQSAQRVCGGQGQACRGH